MNNPMTYIQNGDYLIPDLKLSQQPEKPLGKYGRMRKTYLKEHRPILYNQMLLSEKLYPHLIEIDETAQSRLEQMMPQLAKEAGATEELKASDPIPNDNPETVRCGYVLNSHPAVLDGFIDLVREEQQRSRTQGEKLQPSRPSVRDKLKQELPAHKPAAPKKREPER